MILGILLGTPEPAEIQKAAGRVLLDPDYQRKMPGKTKYTDWQPRPRNPQPVVDDPAPRPRRATTDTTPTPRRRRARTRTERTSGSDAPDLGNALLWMIVVVGGVFLVMWITQLFKGRNQDVELSRPAGAAAPPPPLELAATKTKAERLADEGRFAEAIHVMLLETMGQLARRIPGGLHKSWTSREVLRRTSLPDAAKAHLEALVGAVETSLFGHATPGEVDYRACTNHFQRFASAVDAQAAGRPSA